MKNICCLFLLLLAGSCDLFQASSHKSYPSYCQALLDYDVADKIDEYVREAFEAAVKDIAGAQVEASKVRVRPSADFSDPDQPRLYYSGKDQDFHSTLCKADLKDKTRFSCADQTTLELVNQESINNPVKKYVKFYDNILDKKFNIKAPRKYGAFIAFPLEPQRLYDNQGRVISEELHVSIVKIFTTARGSTDQESDESKALRDKFVTELQNRFNNNNLKTVNFEEVLCDPPAKGN